MQQLRLIAAVIAVTTAVCSPWNSAAQIKSLRDYQQEYVDLKFGMFLHFNIPTFMHQDWADPDADPKLFNPAKLDCSQWARAAKSAKMTYGCLTTKHHSGFCIWDTKTTDYSVMSSDFKRDVVREYVDAFRKEGLKTALYYSILDTHHNIRPGHITKAHIDMIKEQLTELLTNYGEINALVIDGWDAPWSRISYEDIPFEEIYYLVKRLQPGCVIMDLNSAKYPGDVLFYTDIKSYEQGAGQNIEKEANRLPAMSCLPINGSWFWKESFPAAPVKDPVNLVRNNLEPFNQAHCQFLLNAAPNRDGLIDDNAIAALAEIGRLWDNTKSTPRLGNYDAPIISENVAKFKPASSSWSNDMWISDFANDDKFTTSWTSEASVTQPWLEIDLEVLRPVNAVMFMDGGRGNGNITKYSISYEKDGEWLPLVTEFKEGKIKIHRFERVWARKIRFDFHEWDGRNVSIAEVGAYDEIR